MKNEVVLQTSLWKAQREGDSINRLFTCTLRRPTIHDADILYQYLCNLKIRKYSRIKPKSVQHMKHILEQLVFTQDVIARIIVNERNEPAGMICLWDYDVNNKNGYLATWLAEEFWGCGYNSQAKEQFLNEVFKMGVENVYVLIREYNERSLAAIHKLSYVDSVSLEEEYLLRIRTLNICDSHRIFKISKDAFLQTEIVC